MTAACSLCDRKPQFTFNWMIENAHALLVSNEPIFSPIFTVNSIEETKWKLSVYRPYDFGIYFDIEREKDNGPETIEVEIELSILISDGSPIAMGRRREKFTWATESITRLIKNLEEVYVRRADFLPNDALIFRCRIWRTGSEILKGDTCYARTRLNVDRRSFVWAIKEFSCLQQKKQITRVLKPVSKGSPQFILNLHLNTNFEKNYVFTGLNMTGKNGCNTFCIFSLLDSEGRVVKDVENGENTERFSRHYENGHEFYYICEYDKVLNDKVLLQDDVLYVKCEILIETDLAWSQIEHYRCPNLELIKSEISNGYLGRPYESFTTTSPFKRAFEDLYLDESFSDVILQADGKSFCAHKVILSGRSPVFKNMLTRDIPENIINILDLKADTLCNLLLYIYKDIVQETQWGKVMDLFRAADTYELWDLRKKCSFILKSNISGGKVCEILSFANERSDDNLKKAAENFISDRDSFVLSSDGWLKFKEENHQLALEVMEHLTIN